MPIVADAGASATREPMDVSIEVEIAGAVVRIASTAEAKLVTAVVQALRR